MNAAIEVHPAHAPASAAAHPGSSYRVFGAKLLPRKRETLAEALARVLALLGLPRLRERHPDHPERRCHAIIPRALAGGGGAYEVVALYREGVPEHQWPEAPAA